MNVIIIKRRGELSSTFDLNEVGNLKGKSLKLFEKLDLKYGYSVDLAHALETNQFKFLSCEREAQDE